MSETELIDDYRGLLLSQTPLLDVRAPVEFVQGAFPSAINLPLMNDQERQAVGIEYKQAGQEAAIALGHQLVSGQLREQRIAQWAAFLGRHPDSVIYCFRGGLRSQIAQQWLGDVGWRRPRVLGGYKAMRQFLLENLDERVRSTEFVVVGGLTGTGKTDVIAALSNKIDLEALAHHRGSSFGGRTERQPSQINFENSLSIELLRLHQSNATALAVEDEAHLIGRCAVPLALRNKTQQSPTIWVTAALDERVHRIQRDYIESLAQDYRLAFGPSEGIARYQTHLRKSLFNLHKRLGQQRHAQLQTALDEALKQQLEHGAFDGHRQWIEPLLTTYYDPMYEYQRQQRKGRVLFEGTTKEVTAFLQANGY